MRGSTDAGPETVTTHERGPSVYRDPANVDTGPETVDGHRTTSRPVGPYNPYLSLDLESEVPRPSWSSAPKFRVPTRSVGPRDLDNTRDEERPESEENEVGSSGAHG